MHLIIHNFPPTKRLTGVGEDTSRNFSFYLGEKYFAPNQTGSIFFGFFQHIETSNL